MKKPNPVQHCRELHARWNQLAEEYGDALEGAVEARVIDAYEPYALSPGAYFDPRHPVVPGAHYASSADEVMAAESSLGRVNRNIKLIEREMIKSSCPPPGYKSPIPAKVLKRRRRFYRKILDHLSPDNIAQFVKEVASPAAIRRSAKQQRKLERAGFSPELIAACGGPKRLIPHLRSHYGLMTKIQRTSDLPEEVRKDLEERTRRYQERYSRGG